ncbi:MAG: DUF2286 domain-containing protein [Thermoprotei archaeon]|nr:MAG: DUF2286 domain-containing protein [Thermoprotei archaeon]
MKTKLVIVECSEGKCTKIDIKEGELEEVVKNLAKEALGKWNTSESDFFVTHDVRVISRKLPLSKGEFEVLSKFNLRRSGNEAIAEIPVYEISYDNQWSGDSVTVKSIILVAPYIDEDFKNEIIEYAKELTTMSSEEFLEEEL